MTFPNLEQLVTVLGRPFGAADAISPERLRAVEQRLGIVFPEVVTAFYRHVGAAPEFQEHVRRSTCSETRAGPLPRRGRGPRPATLPDRTADS